MSRPDDLDRDPEGTVARARGLYLRALGVAPDDPQVQRAKELSEAVAREAEHRRVARDVAATKARWAALTAHPHGPAYELARNIWYGLPMTGAPELIYPELDKEDALTRGEWFEWAINHKKAGADAMIDHLASILPPGEEETYPDWRERLKRRRMAWSKATDETVVNRHLYPQAQRWAKALQKSGLSSEKKPLRPTKPLGTAWPRKPRKAGRTGSRSTTRRTGPSGN